MSNRLVSISLGVAMSLFVAGTDAGSPEVLPVLHDEFVLTTKFEAPPVMPALEGGNAESHHGLGIVCDLQQDYRSAEIHYRAALDGDPDNPLILGDLGWSYALQNRLQ